MWSVKLVSRMPIVCQHGCSQKCLTYVSGHDSIQARPPRCLGLSRMRCFHLWQKPDLETQGMSAETVGGMPSLSCKTGISRFRILNSKAKAGDQQHFHA